MLETLRNAFKIKDIRNRIIFTFLMLVVIRIGSQLPIPGVNNELFSNWFASQTADEMGFFNLCIEHYTVYYFIHYYAASHYRNSKIGRDAA